MRDEVQEINNKIDTLTALVGDLRLEIRELRQQRADELEAQERLRIQERVRVQAQARVRTQVQERNQTVAEFRTNDRVVIINHYRNQYGRTVTVTRVHGERVYFTIDGRPSYRLRQNVKLEEDFIARTES